MANRIVDQTIIVDSAMGNNLLLSSGGTTINISKLRVNAIGFLASDSTSRMVLTSLNTTNVIFSTNYFANGTGAGLQSGFQFYQFGAGQIFESIKVPVLTAGTGFIYLA